MGILSQGIFTLRSKGNRGDSSEPYEYKFHLILGSLQYIGIIFWCVVHKTLKMAK